MSVILLGMRAGLVMLALSAISMTLLGLTSYSHSPIQNADLNSFGTVAIFTLNYTCVGAFITLTCGKLLKGLSASVDDRRLVAEALADRQAALHASNDELRLTSAALAELNDIVLIVKVGAKEGPDQPVIFANAAFECRRGYRADEIVGRGLRMLHGPDTDATNVKKIAKAMTRREPVTGELIHYTKLGERCWIEVDMVPFSNESQDVTHWVAVGRDITDRRRSADAIHQLAFFDVVTGLPNQRLLMERLDLMVARTHAGGSIGAVLYIDLDKFKHVNDARGHATGDAVGTRTRSTATSNKLIAPFMPSSSIGPSSWSICVEKVIVSLYIRRHIQVQFSAAGLLSSYRGPTLHPTAENYQYVVKTDPC